MKKWRIIDSRPEKSYKKTIDVVESLLSNRGYKNQKEVDNFLNPDIKKVSIEKSGINFGEFKKFKKRFEKTVKNNEKIIIFGDFDVDGICASAILWETLYSISKNVVPYIPDRIEEGYGLSKAGIDNVLLQHPDLKVIITVDNGIVAHEAVNYANSKSIDVVISDHHVEDKKLPSAFCILHTTKLCGAGIAWLIAKELNVLKEDNIDELLSLASLATVADMVPLTGYNRAIVKEGLNRIRQTKRVGLKQLIIDAGVEKESVEVYTLSHVIAPRLNASGRIQSAMNALRLLCTNDQIKAKKLSSMLSDLNKSRQDMTEESVNHAKLLVVQNVNENILIVSSPSYSQGVIGLIASKLVESYYKPSIAISVGEKISKGSARSISGVNIIELIRSVEGVLENAGGHTMAAGFSIRTEMIEEFSKKILQKSKKIVTKELLEKFLSIDCLPPVRLIDQNLVEEMKKLEPYGVGNPQPVFALRGLTVLEVRKMGRDQSHLKLNIEKDGKIFEAVAFGWADKLDIISGDEIDIAYTVDENEWNGRKSLQLKIKDLVLIRE